MGAENHPTSKVGQNVRTSNWNVSIRKGEKRFDTGLTVRASSEIQARARADKRIKNVLSIITEDSKRQGIYSVEVNRIIV